jgi:hypothetical protein
LKIWIDDCRPAPEGYFWITSVNEAKRRIKHWEALYRYNPIYNDDCLIEIIDIDHDAGCYASDGGDYIKLLEWLEETDRNYLIHIHSMNPVGVANMRAIIERNGWREIR